MNATTKPQTTLAQNAQARYNRQRDDLAKAAGTESPERLQDLVYFLQDAEVELSYETTAQRMFELHPERYETIYEARKTLARRQVSNLLSQGAQDTWSGRGNDLRRTKFDSQRNWVTTVLANELY